jgi:addiction module HigA family antidote
MTLNLLRRRIKAPSALVQLGGVHTKNDPRKKRCTERCPTHPGASLCEIVLPAIRASKVEIAAALGISRQSLYDIQAEKQPVTPAMAVRLGKAFGTSATSWLRMQTAYDLRHAEREVDTSTLQALPKAG